MGGGGGQFQLPAFLFLLMLTLTSQDVMLMDKTKRHTAGPRSIPQPPEGRGGGGGDEETCHRSVSTNQKLSTAVRELG